ncbi:MAG: hypothetical protein LH629_07390, partial [Ignavibacteria bacterium]|nr:hypothetical protein [Ignavibacteria bacterium]
MKKVILNLVIIFTITLAINLSAYSANEYYRSIANGNWNATGTWQMSTNSGGTWIAATNAPTDTSGIITIQSPNTVTVTVNVSADQLTVNNGGIISINAAVFLTIKDGSGNDLFLNTGGFISGSGTLQTQGADVTMDLRGTGFTAACKVNPGRTNVYDETAASAIFNGTLTIDAGATLAIVSGGYPVTTKSTVTNNGKITSNGGFFIIKSASFINNDTVRGSNVYFDSTTTLTGAGAYTANVITIRSPGNVLLGNNVTFSPTSSFTINSGGIFNPNTRTFTQNSGTFELNTGGTVSNSGIFQTQNAVTLIIRNSSFFNAPFKVNTGTTSIYNDGGPYVSNFYGTMTVDVGATMTTLGGGYTTRAFGNVTNSGTISGNAFSMRGASITNNGTINPANFQFDSTTSLTSTGSW